MLARKTWHYIPAQVTAPLVQLLSVLAFAHLLPVEEIGTLTLVIAAQEVLFAGLFAWWVQFTLRHRESHERRDFLDAERTALVGAVLTQLCLVLILAGFIFRAQPSAAFVLALSAFVSLRSLSTYMAERARGENRVLLYTVISAVMPGVGLGLAILAAIQLSATAQTMLLAMAVPQGIAVLAALSVTDAGRAAGGDGSTVLPRAFRFGLPMAGAALMSVTALNAPRFVVEQMEGIAAAGVFAVSYGIGVRAASVAVMLVSVGAYPLVVEVTARHGHAAGDTQLARNVTLVMLVAAPIAFGLVAISGSLIDIVFPPALRESAYALLPLATLCGLFRYLRSHGTDQLFLLRSRTDIVAALSAADLVLSVSLAIPAIWQFGLAGAIAGPLVAAVLTWAASLAIAVLRFGFAYPGSACRRIASAAILMMLVVAVLPDTSAPGMLGAHIIAGAFFYVVLIALMFPRTVRQWLGAPKTFST
jgi:O-antigen/teichoic acid export membrane protein